MERRLDEQEQYSRRNNIRVVGLEENADVSAFLKDKLDINVEDNIEEYHPVGRKTSDRKKRQIIVKLKNYATKSLIMGKRFRLKESGFFINDDLTKTRNQYAQSCRSLKKEKKIKDTWIWHGNVLVKLNDGSTTRILSQNDIDQLA